MGWVAVGISVVSLVGNGIWNWLNWRRRSVRIRATLHNLAPAADTGPGLFLRLEVVNHSEFAVNVAELAVLGHGTSAQLVGYRPKVVLPQAIPSQDSFSWQLDYRQFPSEGIEARGSVQGYVRLSTNQAAYSEPIKLMVPPGAVWASGLPVPFATLDEAHTPPRQLGWWRRGAPRRMS